MYGSSFRSSQLQVFVTGVLVGVALTIEFSISFCSSRKLKIQRAHGFVRSFLELVGAFRAHTARILCYGCPAVFVDGQKACEQE